MEDGVVDTAVVALEHVLDGGECVEGLEVAWATPASVVGGAFPKSRDVPDTDGLIHGGGNDQVVFRVEEGGHNVVGVACEDGNAVAGSAVPYADRLVV